MNNVYVQCGLAMLAVIVIFGLPIYGILKFYDWLKNYADSKINAILVEAKMISAPVNKYPILLYSVYGFLNITTEYTMTVYVDSKNCIEIEKIAIRLRRLSYILSVCTLRIHGIFLIWINYRSALNKIEIHKHLNLPNNRMHPRP